jgi:hypothetical protein
MKTINICILFSVSLVSLYTPGCATPPPLVPLYSGPELPKSEVAQLRIFVKISKDLIIDGKELSEDLMKIWDEYSEQNILTVEYIHVALLPGKHEISWTKGIPGMWTKNPNGTSTPVDCKGAGTLNAKAGQKYIISYNVETGEPLGQRYGKYFITTTYKVKSYDTFIIEIPISEEKEGMPEYWIPH